MRPNKESRAKSLHIASRFRSRYWFGRMILTEKSATFRDHALTIEKTETVMPEHASGNNIHTRKIAEFVSTLTYDRITAEVRERIKLLILDSLGCAIYGADLEWCRILRDTCAALDVTRTTSVWGTGQQLSSPHA